jgi:hypothetical protein
MDRLFKSGLTTTLIGLATLIFCGIIIYKEIQTATDMTGWFLFATAMLRAKDSILGLEE